MYIEQLVNKSGAGAAYYLESRHQAALIDPLGTEDNYLPVVEKRKAVLRYIFLTRYYPDQVNNHQNLAQSSGATLVLGPKSCPDYSAKVVSDDELLVLGDIRIKVLHTPGISREASCFLLINEEGYDYALFTGETLWEGNVGQPKQTAVNQLSKRELAGMLFDSLRKKIMPLDNSLILYPGKRIETTPGQEQDSNRLTLGKEKRENTALQICEREEFIQLLTASQERTAKDRAATSLPISAKQLYPEKKKP